MKTSDVFKKPVQYPITNDSFTSPIPMPLVNNKMNKNNKKKEKAQSKRIGSSEGSIIMFEIIIRTKNPKEIQFGIRPECKSVKETINRYKRHSFCNNIKKIIPLISTIYR